MFRANPTEGGIPTFPSDQTKNDLTATIIVTVSHHHFDGWPAACGFAYSMCASSSSRETLAKLVA